MLMTPTQLRSETAGSLLPAHQIYLTHCLHDEGLYRQAGFTVRASSTHDPLLLRFALEYPSYEIPAGTPADALTPQATPRRLALVRIPGGRSILIHSAYRPEAERGRANNYFSHLLVRPNLSAGEALTTWGSPDWATSCDPQTSKDLPPLASLPQGGSLDDRALSEFLRPALRADDHDLATLTCPPRLAGDVDRRRQLLTWALRGCLLALQAGPAAPRGRVYFLAEPGLTALLLYAAARVLPESLAANLTFSTYENAHRDLRSYRQAVAVGTWLVDPRKGLDEDFFTTRGYALDTFNHRASAELSARDATVEEWVELMAQGEWDAIDKMQRLMGKSTSLVSFQEGVQAARVSRRLAAGQAVAADLLALKRSPLGENILAQHRDKVWALVRDASPTDERLREAFADLLRENLAEFVQKVGQALKARSPEGWQPTWRLICWLLQGHPERLREIFQKFLPEPPYPPPLRLAILQELEDLQLSPLDPRQPWHALLRYCTAEDLDLLARSALPREWYVWAIIYAALRGEAREAAARRLHEGQDNIVRTFWEQFRFMRDEAQRRAVLAPLFPRSPQGLQFLSRLLKGRYPVRADTLEWLLDSLGVFARSASEFWRRDNHLALLLDLLRDLGPEAQPLWDRLCKQVDTDMLLPCDPHGQVFLLELAAAVTRLGPAVPPAAAQAIADWSLLRQHFEKAYAVPEEDRRALLDACSRRNLDALTLLARYFERFILPGGVVPELLADFVGFFHSFYLEGNEFEEWSSRVIGWQQVTSVCASETQKSAYQAYYVETFVPAEFRGRFAIQPQPASKAPAAPVARQQPLPPPPAAKPSPTPPRPEPAPVAAPLAGARGAGDEGSEEELFALTGIRLAAGQPSLPPREVWKRFPWLLTALVGGLAAALLIRIYPFKPERFPVVLLFVPLVLALADSMALQATALAVRALRRQTSSGRRLLAGVGKELVIGLLLGAGCGLLAFGVASAWPVPFRMSATRLGQAVAGAIAGGMTAAAVLGVAFPALLRRFRLDGRLAAGPIVRAGAGLAAVVLYFYLASWLLR
jgi:hypothetical protein